VKTMQDSNRHPLIQYLNEERLPHIWCEGCGNGIILNCFIQALDDLKMDIDKLTVVSGIGCIGRIAGYIKCDSFHTTHGRPIALATGIKLANPELTIAVISGDGDLFAIGGNHFIHAARRNVDMTVICANNFNYGMTGGQFGPTTPLDSYTTTTPYGSFEQPLDAPRLAATAGACYSARWTTAHPKELRESIRKAIKMKGFRFIEVVSQCPTAYGRRAGFKNVAEMLKWFKENATPIQQAETMSRTELEKRIVVGKFVERKRPTIVENICAMIKEAQTNER